MLIDCGELSFSTIARVKRLTLLELKLRLLFCMDSKKVKDFCLLLID